MKQQISKNKENTAAHKHTDNTHAKGPATQTRAQDNTEQAGRGGQEEKYTQIIQKKGEREQSK